ncbi:MAG TPA: hypothetical protein VGM23_01840 [Armatimonadota bacterium]
MLTRFRYLPIACWFLLGLFTPGWGQNLLANPSFEALADQGIPAAWMREYHEKLSGPCTSVSDAHSGARAVCLLTQEWNFLRPQYLTQQVALPPGAKTCRLSAYCKGQGFVNLVFQFRKGGQPWQTETVNLGFGPTPAPKEVRSAFALEQDYQYYEAWAQVPEGADAVLVKVGNTIDALDRLNIWGKLLIDDVSLTMETQAKALEPTVALTPEAEIPAPLTNMAPYARITTQPASFDTGLLVDGDVKTTATYINSLERAGNINLFFPGPLAINALQIYLWGNLDALTVRGDADGDGRYETLLARAAGLSGSGWATLTTAATPVRAIRIQAISGKALYAFRTTLPIANEVRVLVPKGAVALPELEKWASFQQTFPVEAGVPEATLQPTDFPIPPLATSHFRKMVCADLWMWGVNAAKVDSPLPDFTKNAVFRKTADGVKAMGVDTVEIDLTNSSVWNLMPWPSKVARGTNENFLKATIDALHAEGFKVVVELIHNITPFETIKWHYPQEDTSRYPGMKQYPSPAFGTYFRDNWLTILDEIMACGADGVGLSSDESYYRPAFLPTLPADDPGRKLYRERFGYDVPAREEDTLQFRQWVLLRHEGICGVYGSVANALRKKYPGIYLNTMWMVPTTGGSNITEIGIPWEMVAEKADISELGSDYMGPYGVRMAAAANGWRKGTMLYSGNLGGTLPEIHYYGTVLWSWMYGAGSADYWRYNWIAGQQGSYQALTNAYTIARELDALGAWKARPPQKIALLSSRASLDWWQVHAWWGTHDDPAWDRGLEGQRGWYADEATFNILQQNGYAFDWCYLDRPDQLKTLDKFSVLVVPFAYSISKEAAERVKAAVSRGAKLVLLDGRMGETDALGERYPAPIFKELVDAGKAIIIPDDILAWGATDSYASKVMTTLNGVLGTENPLALNRYHQHIDATVLEKSPTERFLFLINWEKTPVTVDLGVAVPNGRYQVFVRDETRWYRLSIGGSDRLTREELRKFRVQMAAEKPYVFFLKAER